MSTGYRIGSGIGRTWHHIITLDNSMLIFKDGNKCRIKMRKGFISIDCSDISIEAARHLIKLYDKHFKLDEEIDIQ